MSIPKPLAMLLFGLIAIVLVTLVVALHNLNRITSLENQHFNLLHQIEQTDYRLCYRQQVTRADFDLYHIADPKRNTRILPLYNCTPNLTGGQAILLTVSETAAFEHWVLVTPNVP
jgi:hypothetical protein